MEYISPLNYDYIINKYHDASKPFDGFQRFIRRDELFSPDSGMAPDAIAAGIAENDRNYAHLSHPIRKAKALEYVLKNTRISCDPRDLFPAVNMIDRPIRQTLCTQWQHEVFSQHIPEVETRRAQLERDGIATIWPDYDHSVPDWDRLLTLGFPGILADCEKRRAARTLTATEEDFFEGIRITYEAMLTFLDRLHTQAAATEGSEKMAAALHNLCHGAPQSFYEALLLAYLYFMVSEHIDFLQVRSLSNFDRQYYSFYKSDLARGIPEEALRRELAFYLLQFAAIGNYWNQPVYLGGENADSTTVVNDLSWVFLDVYDRMNLYNPKIQIKVSDTTPKDFLQKALDMIRRGHNSIVFVSDATIRRALENAGISPEAARLCNVTGCYEYSPIGSYNCGMNYVNLLKPLEYALHKGCDGVTGTFSGTVSPAPEEYKTFAQLYAEYKKQLLSLINQVIETVNGFEDYLGFVNPLSLLSATFPSCLEKMRDAPSGGGVTNDSIILFGFLADLADSLAMIQKYVFDRKLLTLPTLTEALDQNFEGHGKLRLLLKNDRDKYGNNRALPDDIAVDLVRFITENVCGRPNAKERSGTWNCGFHVARMSYVQGKLTAASPNGRLLGEELSKNISASMGQNREGATAAILSATKIDATAFTCDAALDLGLLPSVVSGSDGLEAMYALLMTFVCRGGHALHINVFDAATLRAAQAEPEKHRDLQIRVCGWNVLWNNITKEEQDSFILQAEALV